MLQGNQQGWLSRHCKRCYYCPTVTLHIRGLILVGPVPYVPVNMNMGQHFFRVRQLHAHPVREQHNAMLQDRVNQGVLQHHLQQQDNKAYNPRPYQDQQVMSPNRPEEDAPMVNPPNGPQNEQRGPEALSAEYADTAGCQFRV